MPKIKLTKSELKRQRDSLKQFRRYLPTLQLKKQQIQMRLLGVRQILQKKLREFYDRDNVILKWSGVMADVPTDFPQWFQPKEIITETTNIAGVKVPVFVDVRFDAASYDLYDAPFWFDKGVEILRDMIKLIVEMQITRKQIELLEKELRITTQRVNLFEKIKIPECMENIRRIGIYLGDMQANAVGVSKVAKKKVEEKLAVIN